MSLSSLFSFSWTKKYLKTPAVSLLAFLVLFSTTPLYAFESDDFRPDERNRVNVGTLPSRPEPLAGSLQHDYTIAVPPGRTEATTPIPNLHYSSHASENISPLGFGWSIDIPYIQRINRYGTESLYSSYDFYSTLDGEIASTSAATSSPSVYGAKSDDGSFRKYTHETDNSWTITDKDGLTYTFGTSTLSRLDNPGNSTQVFRWMLEEVRDTNDNYIKYEYYKDDGQIYPSQITYSGHASTDGIFKVIFERESRSDIATSSMAGFPVVSDQRVNRIEIQINGSWVTRYDFTYSVGDNGHRSILSSIIKTGRDELGVTTTLPATILSYQASTTNWTLGSSSGVPVPFSSNGTDFGTRLADVNGDGRVDFVRGYAAGGVDIQEVYINNATTTGWRQDTSWNLPVYFSNGGSDSGARLTDVNGDGFVDIVKANEQDGAKYVYLNNATTSGWTLDSSWIFPEYFTNNVSDFGVRIVDVNGDGLTDIIRSTAIDPGTNKVYINNGHGWTLDGSFSVPIYFSNNNGHDYGAVVIDVNGDGLNDIIESHYHGTGTQRTFLNNGLGWTEVSNSWDAPEYFTSDFKDQGTRVVDVNGDDLPDIVRSQNYTSTPNKIYINTGNGWTLDEGWMLPGYIVWGLVDNGARFADVDGDGANDFILNGYIGTTTVNNIYLASSSPTDVLTNIFSETGGQTHFEYKMSGEYIDESGNGLANSYLPFNLQTVHRVGVNDGFGTVGTTTYKYEGGSFYYASSTDRKFAGFNIVSEIDPVGNVFKQYFHQGNSTDSGNGEYSDNIAKLGRVYRTEIEDSSGNDFDLTINKWDSSIIANGNKFIQLLQSLKLNYDGDVDHKDSAESFLYDTSSGNILQHKRWGEVTGSTNGTFSDTDSDTITTDYTYATSSTTSFNKISSEIRYNQSATKVSEDKYYFDGQTFGGATLGNLTKKEHWVSGTTYIDTERTYNAYGLVLTEKDPRDKQTTYTYDTFSLHVATSTNPLSQQTYFYFDYSLGKPKKTIDVNGLVFETVYDGLDRILTEKQPDLTTPTTLVTKKSISYVDTIGNRSILEESFLDGSTSATLYTYLDGFNRKVQTRKEAEDATYAVRDYRYDTRGMLRAESLPYFSSGTTRTTPTTNTALFSTYAYDSLARLQSVATVVGTTTTSYDQWASTVTDPLSNTKDYTYDAYGRLASVIEYNDATPYTTSYQYDPLGNLTKVTDAEANIRNFTYDGLSRRLTAEDLHDVADGTFGSWSYLYDASGNLASSTDPIGNIIDYTYDNLNRVTAENHTGGAGTEVEYAYDSCTYGIGKLCTATSTGATTTFSYNALGGIASETKTINSTPYTTSYTYNRQGNMSGMVYPDNAEVSYTYNTAGLLETIAHKESGGSFFNLVNDLDYAPTERISFKSLANGVQSTYTYNPNELYRLTNIFTTAPEGGGEGFAFGGNDWWGTLARATEELPLALKIALAFDEETSTQEPTPEPLLDTDTEPVVEDVPPETTPASEETIPVSEETVSVTEEETISEEVSVEEIVPLEETLSEADVASAEENTEEGASITESTLTDETTEVETILSLEADLPLRTQLEGKSPEERATLKGRALAAVGALPKTDRAEYSLEIVSLEEIEGGVQAFVRAWRKDGTQIGFGTDGTVDIERFRIFNPPVLVPDPNGDINQQLEKDDVETGTKITISRTLREDPKEALLQVIEHTLSVMKNVHGSDNIIPGEKGKTTSTFFPNPGTGTAPVDGVTAREVSGESWSTIRSGSGNAVDNSSWYNAVTSYNGNGGSSYERLSRSIFGFNTSPLGIGAPKIISSAVFSIKGINKYGSGASQSTVVIDRVVPPNQAQLSNSDFNIANWNGVEQASNRITYNSWSTSNYNDFTLNATGTSNISTSTNTWFGTRARGDFEDDTPVSANSVGIEGYFADRTGTTDDPKLVVEHTSSNNAPGSPTALQAEGETNPPAISDATPEFSAIYDDPEISDLATAYRIQVATSSDFVSVVWDSTKNTLASSTPENSRIADISYGGTALASSTTYYWRIKLWDYEDTEGAWSTATSTFVLASQTVPPPPSGLLAEGQTNPVNISDITPEFSAIFEDNDYGEVAQYYQVQVSATSSFASTVWDSNKTILASSTPAGSRIADISYSGQPLVTSITYYWRIRFWDSSDFIGAWSTTTSTFNLESPSGVREIQHISFAYDVVGNIVNISDISSTTAGKTINYGYDDLYRLTSASTTAANSTPFSHTYSYNSLGNITSKSGAGSYSYGEIGYANPHAVTSVAGINYSYDKNGNIINYASTTNAWDFRNRLTAVYASSSPSTFFTYDHTVQRVSKGTGTATTTYANKYYNVDANGKKTKHVFVGDELISSIETSVSGGGAGDTGAKTAGATPSTTGWSNFTTTRLGTSDNSKASCNSTCDNTDNGQLGTFTFNVPSGATINGIEVKAEMAEGSSSGNIGTLFSLSWNNGTNFTSTKSITVDGTTDTVYTAGNSSDTWGRTWSDTELNNTNFRLKLDKSDSSDTLYVDHVTVKVFYTTSGTPTTTIQFIHSDHLGGTNVVTNQAGDLIQTLDYYPFGSDRINTGTFSEQRTFIGEQKDSETNLNYLNARYYFGDRGKFISQDPVFINLGVDERTEEVLKDPQLANAYSYARNNPLVAKDPEGEFYIQIFRGAAALYSYVSGLFLANEFREVKESHGGQLSLQQEAMYTEKAVKFIVTSAIPGAAKAAGFAKNSKQEVIATLGTEVVNEVSNHLPTLPQSSSNIYQTTPSVNVLPSIITQNGNTYYRNGDGSLSPISQSE